MLWNSLPNLQRFDSFPFTFLTLVVSLEAIFLSTFILISQNQETKLADRRNHLDLQINLLTEQENTRMLNMLEAIVKVTGAKVRAYQDTKGLEEETDPESVDVEIDRQMAQNGSSPPAKTVTRK